MDAPNQAKVALRERSVPGLHASLLESFRRYATRESSVLDVGCGSGAWAERLREDGFRSVWCVDNDTAQYKGKSPFSRVDLNGDFPDAVRSAFSMPAFDVITTVEVIEHLENTSAFLRRCASLLVPSGLLVVTTPNVLCAPSRLKFLLYGNLRHFDECGDPTHISPIFPRLLDRLAQSTGLDLECSLPLPNDSRFNGTSPVNALVSRLLSGLMRGETKGDCTLFVMKRRETQSNIANESVK
ncbi:MAG: class I SAM-dependent methyltransferase [Bryobacteraceae bacterium]|jgi:SAM-dependent methyltransferase